MSKYEIRKITYDLKASMVARDSLLTGLNILINAWPDITKKFDGKVMNLRFKKHLSELLYEGTPLYITGSGNDYRLSTPRKTFYNKEDEVNHFSNITDIYFEVETNDENRITSLEKTLNQLKQNRDDMVYHIEQDGIAIEMVEKYLNSIKLALDTAQDHINALKIPLDARQSISQRMFYGRDIQLRI